MKYTCGLKLQDKNANFGRDPSCDLVNNAIRFIINGKTDAAIDNLFRAILIADGYFHRDIADEMIDAHNRVVDNNRRAT